MKMKSVYIIILAVLSFLASPAVAASNKCVESNEYSFFICGDWKDGEIEEILPLYSGTEELHKLIKQKENYYILHTCSGRTKDQTCMGGFVYVFERIEGNLKQKPDIWDWVF